MQLLNKSNISINEKKDGGWPMKPGTVIGRTLHHTVKPFRYRDRATEKNYLPPDENIFINDNYKLFFQFFYYSLFLH